MVASNPRVSQRLSPGIVVLLALLLIVATGFSAPRLASAKSPVPAETVKRDYLVELAPAAGDAALLSAVRQSLGRVDETNLSLLESMSDAGANAADAYRHLADQLGANPGQSSWLLISGVPTNLMRAYEQGNLTRSALFAAATSVTSLSAAQARTSRAIPVKITRSTLDQGALTAATSAFDSALTALTEQELAVATGRMRVNDLANGQLTELARAETAAGDAAQLELDRRLAQNLPDLTGVSNGELPDDLLCPIPWQPNERLLCAAMDNFIRLNEAYHLQFGTDLPILNGYRDLASQYQVHWDAPDMTAIPGQSNHGFGQAIDFNWDIFSAWDAPEVSWMLEHGPSYGFRLPSALGPDTDRPEPWHYEFGTSYSENDRADFLGPTPAVVYKIKSQLNPIGYAEWMALQGR